MYKVPLLMFSFVLLFGCAVTNLNTQFNGVTKLTSGIEVGHLVEDCEYKSTGSLEIVFRRNGRSFENIGKHNSILLKLGEDISVFQDITSQINGKESKNRCNYTLKKDGTVKGSNCANKNEKLEKRIAILNSSLKTGDLLKDMNLGNGYAKESVVGIKAIDGRASIVTEISGVATENGEFFSATGSAAYDIESGLSVYYDMFIDDQNGTTIKINYTSNVNKVR